MVIGAALVFFACFVVMYEAIVWESSNPLAIAVVALVLFLVFILPIINSVRLGMVEYPYYERGEGIIRFEDMIDALKAGEPGDVALQEPLR